MLIYISLWECFCFFKKAPKQKQKQETSVSENTAQKHTDSSSCHHIIPAWQLPVQQNPVFSLQLSYSCLNVLNGVWASRLVMKHLVGSSCLFISAEVKGRLWVKEVGHSLSTAAWNSETFEATSPLHREPSGRMYSDCFPFTINLLLTYHSMLMQRTLMLHFRESCCFSDAVKSIYLWARMKQQSWPH